MHTSSPFPQRHGLRLPTYNYAQPGAYFITICSHRRLPLFGAIDQGEMHLTPAGHIVEEKWLRTPSVRPHVTIESYVVMPNHCHCILLLDEPPSEDKGKAVTTGRSSFSSPSNTMGAIVRGVKGASTARIHKLDGHETIKVWQREYYDHVIRDERDLERIREYIQNNVLKWELDRYYLRGDGSFTG